LDITIDRLTTHRALVAALFNPVFYAGRMIEMVSRAVEFGDCIRLLEGSHTDYTLIFIAYSSEQLFGKLNSRNASQDRTRLGNPISL
jgi:hypothetical protein|tara:strand:- start:579 stop:839 length:261 start_codon:yes stop_codon:yes gene_type:complete